MLIDCPLSMHYPKQTQNTVFQYWELFGNKHSKRRPPSINQNTLYSHNAEGSVTEIAHNENSDLYFWDDNQRLMAIMNSTGLHHYFYDHTGQRVLKGTLRSVSGAINGSQSYQDLIMDEYVVYVNPFYTVTHYNDHTEATKHYYMNAQRVATSVISYMSSSTQLPASYEPFEPETPGTVNVIATIIDKLFDWEILAYPSAEINFQHILEPIDLELLYPSSYYHHDIEPCESDPRCMCEQSQYYSKVLYDIDCYQINITYWYHPDYLGSIEWVTNADGRPVEYFWYSPWGETLQEDNSWRGRFSSPFKFTGHIEDHE
jgi:hypothetical protein